MEEKELLRNLIIIILAVCSMTYSMTVLGSSNVISEQDIEFAEKLQTQLQQIINKGLKAKYQEFEQISKKAGSTEAGSTEHKALEIVKTVDVTDVTNVTDIADASIKSGVIGDDNTRLRIFVSSSMSLNLLRSYYKEARRYRGHLVFNGLPNGSFKELLKLAQEIVANSDVGDMADIGGIEIDDEAFKSFKVMQVPVIILSREVDSLFNAEGAALKYDAIQGAISIKYALEEFATRGDMKAEAKQRLERLGQ